MGKYKMKLTIVYDNEVFKKEIGLKSDWGFSCLIESNDTNILFDTGTKGNILLDNMRKLNLDPKIIDKIVISHEHGDHNGGLNSLLSYIGNVEIFKIGSNSINEKIKTVEGSQLVSEGIYTTGRLAGSPIDEQSLVLKGKKGWYVLVGCSHPGVEKILHKARQIGNIVGIIGGFHGFNDLSILNDLDLICPCHCTKYKKEIKMTFPKVYYDCGVGKIIDLNMENEI